MKINFRQGIISHQSGGFLQITGSNVNILAANRSVTVSIAQQFTNYTHSEDNSVSVAWTLAGIPNEFLYWNFNQLTFERTFGTTPHEPVAQSVPPGAGDSPIVGVQTGAAGIGNFVVEGQYVLVTSKPFVVTGSTGNNGSYTVASVSYSTLTGNTTITPVEAVANSAVDGVLALDLDFNGNPLYVEGRHWYDTANNIHYVLQNGIWTEVLRVFAAQILNGSTIISMGQNSGDFTGTQIGNNNFVASGRVLFAESGNTIRRDGGTFFTTEDQFFTNQARVDGLRLESNVTRAQSIGGAALAAFSVVAWIDDGIVRSAKYDDTGSTVLGLLTEPLTTNQVGAVIVQGTVTNPAWTWTTGIDAVPVGSTLWAKNGALVSVDPNAEDPITNPVKHVPVARVLSVDTVIFEQGLGGVGPAGEGGSGSGISTPATASNLGVVTLVTPSSDPTRAWVISDTDSRLTDSRTPLPHVHQAVDIAFTPGGGIGATDVQNGMLELGLNKLNLTGGTLTGPLLLNADPTVSNGAATKQYVDALAAGIDAKLSVAVGTTADIGGTYSSSGGTALTGGFVGVDVTALDGAWGTNYDFTLTNRILVKDQTTATQNGIYVVLTGSPFDATNATLERAEDHDGIPQAEVSEGNYAFIAEGLTQSGAGWIVLGGTASGAGGVIILNVDAMNWGQVSSATAYFGGTNISIDGSNNINVVQAVDGGTVDAFAWSGYLITPLTPIVGQPLIFNGGVSWTNAAFALPNIVGSDGQFLQSDGVGNTTWETPVPGVTNPMSVDLITAGYKLKTINGEPITLQVDNFGGNGGAVNIIAGVDTNGGAGGGINLTAGSAYAPEVPGGSINLTTGYNFASPSIRSAVVISSGQYSANIRLLSGRATVNDARFYTNISNPSLLEVDTNFTLPPDNGTSGQVLQTDGFGITTWAEGGGQTPWTQNIDANGYVLTTLDVVTGPSPAVANSLRFESGSAGVGGIEAAPAYAGHFIAYAGDNNVAEYGPPTRAGAVVLRAGNTAANGYGGVVVLTAGNTAGGFDIESNRGGLVQITAGNNTGTFGDGNGGDVTITAGNNAKSGYGTGRGGDVTITAGNNDGNGESALFRAGAVNIIGGNTYGYYGGNVNITTGLAYGGPVTSGSINLTTPDTQSGGGQVIIKTGDVTAGGNQSGSDVLITAGDGLGNFNEGGDILLTAGSISGSPTSIGGKIILQPGAGDSTNGSILIVGTDGSYGGGGEGSLQIRSGFVNTTTITVPVLAASTNFTLPPDNGTAGYVLSTDGTGITTWIAGGGASNNWLTANNGADFPTAPSAAGTNAIAIGNNTTSDYRDTVAIGTNITADFFGVALGNNSTALNYCVAVGSSTNALLSSIAIGHGVTAGQTFDITIGRNLSTPTTGTGANVIIGLNNIMTTNTSGHVVAIGSGNLCVLPEQTAIGRNLTSSAVTTDVGFSVKLGAGAPLQPADKNMLHLFDKGKLELYGNEAQFILPNYTTAEIAVPLPGLSGGMVFDSDTSELKINDGTNWNAVGGSSNNWITANNGNDFSIAPVTISTNAIAIGNNASTGISPSAIAIGTNAKSNTGVAIGPDAYSTQGDTIAIGDNAQARITSAIGIGRSVDSNASNAIVIGSGASASMNDTIAIGTNVAADGNGNRNIIIGYLASMAGAGQTSNTVVIGSNASAGYNDSGCVAIGSGATTTKTFQTMVGPLLDGTVTTTDVSYSAKFGHGLAGVNKNMLHLFSKGKLELYGDEAQFVIPNYTTAEIAGSLPGVSGGLVFDTDTSGLKTYDGVNWNTVGGGNNWLVANNGDDFGITPIATGTNSIAIGNNSQVTVVDGIAIGLSAIGGIRGISIGNNSTSTTDAVAIGNGAKANSNKNTAVGFGCTTSGNFSTAIGHLSATGDSSSVSIGDNCNASAASSVVIGDTSSATQIQQVVIGNGIASVDVATDVPYSAKLGYAGTTTAELNMLHLFSKGKLELYGDEAQLIFPNYDSTGAPALPSTTNIGGAVWDVGTKDLRVYDGTAWNAVGAPAAVAPQYEKQIIAGTPTIVNTTIPTTASSGGTATLQVFRNGALQEENISGGVITTEDFDVTGATQITFATALINADKIIIYAFE